MPFRNTPNTIVIPPDAGPGEPRIVIGNEIPAPLDTYEFKDHLGIVTGNVAVGGIFFYNGVLGDDYYNFLVLVHCPLSDDLIVQMGYVDAGSVAEVAANQPSGQQWRAETPTLHNLFHDALEVIANTDNDWLKLRRPTDTFSRFALADYSAINGPRLEWGAGNIAARDVNLFREAANQLKTDDDFYCATAHSNTNGSFTALALGTGVADGGAGNSRRHIRRLATGQIELQVDLAWSGASGAQVLTLPAWALPSTRYRFPVATNSSATIFNAHLDLNTNGAVNFFSANAASVTWFGGVFIYTP